jgi:hypothetical protein
VKFFPAVLLILGGDLSTKHLLKEFIMANCDSPECLQALTRLQEARNRILSLCSIIEQLRADQESRRATMTSLMLAILATLAALVWVLTLPFPFDLIAGIAVGIVLAGLLIAWSVLLSQVNNLEKEISEIQLSLSEARNGFSNAVSEVMATCDPECWNLVDFDQPECPLKEKG